MYTSNLDLLRCGQVLTRGKHGISRFPCLCCAYGHRLIESSPFESVQLSVASLHLFFLSLWESSSRITPSSSDGTSQASWKTSVKVCLVCSSVGHLRPNFSSNPLSCGRSFFQGSFLKDRGWFQQYAIADTEVNAKVYTRLSFTHTLFTRFIQIPPHLSSEEDTICHCSSCSGAV
jgi:hypothetical protein